MPAASHSAGLFIDAACLPVCHLRVCVCARARQCTRVGACKSERAIKRWVCECVCVSLCVCVCACVCVCMRSPPAAESRERRGTGRVGGEVMSGTRQRPTDEREGGEGEEARPARCLLMVKVCWRLSDLKPARLRRPADGPEQSSWWTHPSDQ